VTVFYHDRVYVYSLQGIKPSQSGWRAADFSENRAHIWAGMLRITSSTTHDDNFVVLEHDTRDGGKKGVFASCLATRENIEQVIDSSRFYVLRISDGKGSHAFIGMGFQDKQPAFDFKSELASLGNKARARDEMLNAPKQDFSLQKGAKITVNLKGVKGAPTKSAPAASAGSSAGASAGGADFSAFAIAPPSDSRAKPTVTSHININNSNSSHASGNASSGAAAGNDAFSALFAASGSNSGAGSSAVAAATSPSSTSTAAEFDFFATGAASTAGNSSNSNSGPSDPFAVFSAATSNGSAAAAKPAAGAAAADKKKSGNDPFDFGEGWAF